MRRGGLQRLLPGPAGTEPERLQRGRPDLRAMSRSCNPACTATLWDPVANVSTATTLVQDSNAQGYVCRHNNQLYAVSGVGGNTPFTYPRIEHSTTSTPPTRRASRRTRSSAHFDRCTGICVDQQPRRLPDHRHDDQHSAPLLHDRLGPVLRPHRHYGERSVEGLRHRRLPGEQRPAAAPRRQVRQVHTHRPRERRSPLPTTSTR